MVLFYFHPRSYVLLLTQLSESDTHYSDYLFLMQSTILHVTIKICNVFVSTFLTISFLKKSLYHNICFILYVRLDELGCSADVINLLDHACSGMLSCEYPIHSKDLYATKPCSSTVASYSSYLEVSYECVKGRVLRIFIFASV